MRILLLGVVVCLAASPATAQVMAMSPTMSVGFAGVAAAHHANVKRSRSVSTIDRSNGVAAALAAGPVIGAAAAARSPLAYASTPTSRQVAATAYAARLQKADPDAAAALEAQMARHDFGKVYSGIVRPFGLASDDAADALAGYTVLGWLIATGAPDPDRSSVRAVRSQLAGRLAQTPNFRSETARQAVGEELKISFVTLHAGWQAARKEGTLRQYSDGVAAMFQRNGIDLRALRLTEQGFVRG